MIWAAALLTIAVMAAGFWIIEKKRAAGTLTYPLWRGNLFLPWAGLALVFVLLIGISELPRAMGLADRGMPTEGSIIKTHEYCEVDYRYKVGAAEYTGKDSKCGLKAGNTIKVFYDASSPDASTLYLPKVALKETLIAMALISTGLPTLIVLWLMFTHVIGFRKKQ
jgi:Protein of unknown function (DUF3592)